MNIKRIRGVFESVIFFEKFFKIVFVIRGIVIPLHSLLKRGVNKLLKSKVV
jgi:hypothetical protein